MKPCRRYRKPIALHVVEALDITQSKEVTMHLAQCEACNHYHEEILRVAERLDFLGSLTPAQASRRRIDVGKELAGEPTKLLGWSFGLAALAAIAVAVLVLSALMRHSVAPRELQPQTHASSLAPAPTDFLPTIANYRAVANESLDEFDALLARQARKPVPTPPSFTATKPVLLSITVSGSVNDIVSMICSQ